MLKIKKVEDFGLGFNCMTNDKKSLHIPPVRVIISVGTLMPIRDTQMILETLKTKNYHEK